MVSASESGPGPAPAPAPEPDRPRATGGFGGRLRHLGQRLKYRLLDVYPPFFGAGVRVRRLPAEPGAVPGFESRMKLRWWNRNIVGTHFGGSLYSMCDPFFVLLLIEGLGPGFVVWDKEAAIRFRRPGRGTVRARFEISAERLEEIRHQALAAGRRGEAIEPRFEALVRGPDDQVVARVEKVLHVRSRERPAGETTGAGASRRPEGLRSESSSETARPQGVSRRFAHRPSWPRA